MARGKKVEPREVGPDFVYNDETVAKFINYIMQRGKKSIARKIVYGAFDIIKKKTSRDPLEVFKEALKNVGPSLEVRPRRIGGATYQIPREVRGERRLALSLRWIIQAAKQKKGRSMREGLAEAIMNASNNTGWAVKKKDNTHRMAEANRAFAHFAW